jgi:cyclase
MSVAIRVIPCLDVTDGRVVKGVNFTHLRDAGDPVELSASYGVQGADEITFLDISASTDGRATTRDMVTRCAENVFIPLTVGGGVRSSDDVDALLRCGADKVGINTGAIACPEAINEITTRFGNQVLVLSLDARREPGMPSGYGVTTHGGTQSAGLDAIEWVREAVARGCGEVLLNSMDADGTRDGFDLEMTAAVRQAVEVPLIASGGAGTAEHFVEAVRAGADAVLAASVFHYRQLTIAQVKQALDEAGFPVRRTAAPAQA